MTSLEPVQGKGFGTTIGWILGVGGAVAAVKSIGVPLWLAGGFAGGYAGLVGSLVGAACRARDDGQRWQAYRLLRALTPWWPALAEAVRPDATDDTFG